MSTLAKISFDYQTKLTPEQQREIKEMAFEAPFTPSDKDDNIWSPVIMLIEDAAKFGQFKVEQILPDRIKHKLTASTIGDFEQRNTTVINEKCNVSVGGLGLLIIDSVKVANDYCTEALQKDLNDGWRIVAICVQPDQRRPDYILGRTEK